MSQVFGTTPHGSAPDGSLDVWFTDPPGLLVVMRLGARLTVSSAEWLATHVYRAMDARYPGKPFYFFHDWGAALGYETAARTRMNKWAAAVGRDRINHVGLIVSPQAPTLVRMGASMATLAMSLLGVSARVYDNRTQALAAHPIAPLAEPPTI
jgi:hypothetical protein